MYNLSLFGKRIREIRKEMNHSIELVADLSGINCETIRRMEQGKVTPKLETLDQLSPILKKNLHLLLLEYKHDNFARYQEVKDKLEAKFDGDDHHSLDDEITELEQLKNSAHDTYYKSQIEQLILLAKAVIHYKSNKELNLGFNELMKAMKFTIRDFRLSRYNLYTYSSTEARILMNIAFILNKKGYRNKYLRILEFCEGIVDPNSQLYCKVCHNLAGAYIRIKDYSQALLYSDRGIEYCQRKSNINGLNMLLYSKGVAQYNLQTGNYIDSFKKAVVISDALNQQALKETIIAKCKKFYNLDLKDQPS